MAGAGRYHGSRGPQGRRSACARYGRRRSGSSVRKQSGEHVRRLKKNVKLQKSAANRKRRRN